MSEKEKFEKSFQRPRNFFDLTPEQQYQIDKKLGILDWMGIGLTDAEADRFSAYYEDSKELIYG